MISPYQVAPEQWPIPCNRCGGNLRMTGQPSPYGGAVTMGCPYCQAVEYLPAEPSERVRVANERIALLKMAQDAAEGPKRAVDKLMQAKPWMGGLVVGGVLALNGFNSFATTYASLARAADALEPFERWKMLFQTWAFTLGGMGFAVGGVTGWWFALKAYRRAVEPESWARPPLVPQGAARCRCCGADLVMHWGAMVTCAFCQTQNLLDRAIIDRRDTLLADETLAHQQRAAGVFARSRAAYQNFTRWWWVGALLGAAAMLGVSAAIASLS